MVIAFKIWEWAIAFRRTASWPRVADSGKAGASIRRLFAAFGIAPLTEAVDGFGDGRHPDGKAANAGLDHAISLPLTRIPACLPQRTTTHAATAEPSWRSG